MDAAPRLPVSGQRWWPAPIAGGLALALYARTLAPGLTWAHNGSDGGDLLAAALTHGVPHPSGYPTYQLLLRAAIATFPGEPARAGNWLSAVCAAIAVALLAGLSQRMLATWSRNAPPAIGLVAVAAALAWGASPTLWGQAVVTEVYTLNALAAVALLALLWRWHEAVDCDRAGWPWLAGAGLVLGLGLGNHLSLALMLPGAVAWLWSSEHGSRASLARSLPAVAAATAAGLAVYAYVPWAAATNSPVNWEDPQTLAGFWRLISGQAYRGLVFGVPGAYLPGRLAAWAGEALRQLSGPWSALLALAGLWRLDRRAHAWWRATGLIALAYSLYAVTYNTSDSFVYLIPVWCMAALWLAAGLDWLLEVVEDALRRRFGVMMGGNVGQVGNLFHKSISRADASGIALAVVLAAAPAVSVARFWRENDLSREQEARRFVASTLADAASGAVILTAGDQATFALWYGVYGLGQRPDVAPVNIHLYAFDWYRRSLEGRHPDLAAAMGNPDAPRFDDFLAAVAATRPIYRADELNTIPLGFVEEPTGSLVRLSKRTDK